MTTAISVLVVEDEPLAAQAHGEFVNRVAGFRLAGTAATAQEAIRFLRNNPVDMVLLDFNLPDAHGLEICRALRVARADVDVIAVTANRDLNSVRSAVSLGVVQYVLKPFTFRSLAAKLEQYREFREQLRGDQPLADQIELDRAFSSLRRGTVSTLPSGLSEETLRDVSQTLQGVGALSALEVATRCSVSRVTARRYLEHLVESGVVDRQHRHGGSGRPEVEYRWRSAV